MAKFKIKDAQGNVANTIVAGLEYVEEHYAGLFEEVPEPPAAAPSVVLVPKDIIVERCTDAEWARFSDPATNIPGISTENVAKVRRIYDLFMTKTGDVNVASPRASAMGTALVQLGVLANAQREAAIFAAA